MPQRSAASGPDGRTPDRQSGSASAFLSQALEVHRSGDHARAERILRQLVGQRPDAGAAWHLRGLNAAAAGNRDLASRCLIEAVSRDTKNPAYCAALARHLARIDLDHAAVEPWLRAIELAPDNATYRAELAYCLSRLGRYGDALPHFEAAACGRTHDAGFMAAHGTALLNAGDAAGAVARLRDAFEASSSDPSIAVRLGYALQQAGQEADAVRAYRDALTLDPALHEALLNLSVCLRILGETDAAIEACRQLLARHPESVGAMNNLGIALCDAGRYDEAIVALERALRSEPENATALHNLGVALDAQDAPSEAEACFRKCLALQPGWSEAQRSLANLLRSRGQFAEAASLYRAVVNSRPRDFTSYGNLGLALLNLNRPEEAISVYEKAVALRPDRPELRFGLGVAQLAAGDLADGWANYDARLDMVPAPGWRPGHQLPRWSGEGEAGHGGAPTVLVHAEQGFGDTLQFCRYVPLAAARGATVVFECQAPLAALMRSLATRFSLPSLTVITPADPMPVADFHIPLLSLPGLFTRSLEAIPADIPYLAPSADKRKKWSRGPFGRGPSVGLVWAGNPKRQDDRLRSCPTEALAPILAIDGIDLYSLQIDAPGDPIPGVPALGPSLDDFGDTAAAIERLDLVISVDTAAAHLAGALGKPVWVMLGKTADWRYLLDREDSPWYPTMRLFRQSETGSWLSVTERIAQAMRDAVAAER